MKKNICNTVKKETIKEKEKTFRQAAAEGNTALMLSLLKQFPEIDINSEGPLTGKSALYRAAENNKLDVLHLLCDFGASLKGLKDRQGCFPISLAQDETTKNFFHMTYIAGYLIDVTHTNLFPITTMKHNKAYNEFAKNQRSTWKQSRQLAITDPIFEMFDHYPGFDFLADQKACRRLDLSAYLSRLQVTIDLLFMTNIKHVGSGEFTYFAYAVLQKCLLELPFSVEIIDIYDPHDVHRGHNFLVFDRDPTSQLNDPKTWGRAIIVDLFYKHIYSARFLSESKRDSLLKKAKDYRLISLFSKTEMGKGFEGLPEVKEKLEKTEKKIWAHIQDQLQTIPSVIEVQKKIAKRLSCFKEPQEKKENTF